MLSMLPMMKCTPSGDQARSYISAPLDRHICFARHASLSSTPSEPKWVGAASLGTQRITLPSSPAEASISPVGRATSELSQWQLQDHDKLTFGSPPNNIDGLIVFCQRREVFHLAFLAIA